MSVTRKISKIGKDAPFLIQYNGEKAVFLNGFLIHWATYDIHKNCHDLDIIALNLSNATGYKVVSIVVEGTHNKTLLWKEIYQILASCKEEEFGLKSTKTYL